MQLFKDTYKINAPYEKELDKVVTTLQYKTLVMHFVMMLSRACFSALGQSYWQKAYDTIDSNPNLRREFVDTIEPYVRHIIIALIPVGFLLDLFAWRSRKFANYILYYEMVSMVV